MFAIKPDTIASLYKLEYLFSNFVFFCSDLVHCVWCYSWQKSDVHTIVLIWIFSSAIPSDSWSIIWVVTCCNFLKKMNEYVMFTRVIRMIAFTYQCCIEHVEVTVGLALRKWICWLPYLHYIHWSRYSHYWRRYLISFSSVGFPVLNPTRTSSSNSPNIFSVHFNILPVS